MTPSLERTPPCLPRERLGAASRETAMTDPERDALAAAQAHEIVALTIRVRELERAVIILREKCDTALGLAVSSR